MSLRSRGFSLLDHIRDTGTLVATVRSLCVIRPHRDSADDGVTTIEDRRDGAVRGGFAGFGAGSLEPHTDRTGTARPPGLVFVACAREADAGGECVMADGREVYRDLARAHPAVLQALSAPASALFGGPDGHLGSIFSADHGRMRIRLRLDELASYAPGVTRHLPLLHDVIERHSVTFGLSAGQGYVVDNHRWLHGRRAFTGRRVLYRISGDPHPQTGIRPGFIPFDGSDAGHP